MIDILAQVMPISFIHPADGQCNADAMRFLSMRSTSTGDLTAGDRQSQVGLWIRSFCAGSTSNQQRGQSYDGL